MIIAMKTKNLYSRRNNIKSFLVYYSHATFAIEVSAFVTVSRDHLLVLEKLSKSLMTILNTILRTVDQDPFLSR